MLIKILKDEYLFCETGTHICDSNGFAIKAEQDAECEVSAEHVERVNSILTNERLSRGLNADGSIIQVSEDIVGDVNVN